MRAIAVVCVMLVAATALLAAPAAPRPSIVLILTNDQRYDTLPYMPTVRQELVGRGVTFANGFVTTPLCCPSRASILSGQYAHHTGVLTNTAPDGGATRFQDASTIATWLQSAGYQTGLFGKYLNGYGQLSPYVPPGWDDWAAFVGTSFFNYALNENGTIRRYGAGTEEYSTDVIARKAVTFIERARSVPVFVYFAPFAPHAPATPHPRDGRALGDLLPWRPPSYNEADVSDKPAWVQRLPALTAAAQQRGDIFRRRQLQSLQAVDSGIGAIIDALRRAGRLESTAFILLSDNGLSWGEHRWLDRKGCPYEECIRVPFVVVLPGIPSRTDAHPVLNIDIAPTIAELSGLRPPTATDGRSLLPLLRERSVPWRDAFLIEFWGGRQTFAGLRTDRWAYVEYANEERELYDLAGDPDQLHNLAGDERFSGMIAEFRTRLQQLRR